MCRNCSSYPLPQPLVRLVHRPGSFVITFPNAYHAGFNTGFNCAEAVNFAPPDWIPFGSDVVRKYRSQGKPLTISHDQLMITLVQSAPLVAAAKARRLVQETSSSGRGVAEVADGGLDGLTRHEGDVDGLLDPDGIDGWMRRWDDGVSLGDVSEEAVRLAVGELTLRVEEEGARRGRAKDLGVDQVGEAPECKKQRNAETPLIHIAQYLHPVHLILLHLLAHPLWLTSPRRRLR